MLPALIIKKNGIYKIELANNIRIFELSKLGNKVSKLEYLAPLKLNHFKNLRNYLKSSKIYDVIIVNDIFWSLSLSSLILLQRHSINKIILINHGFFKPMKNRILKAIIKMAYKVAIVFFSNNIKFIISYSPISDAEIKSLKLYRIETLLHPFCIDLIEFNNSYNLALALKDSFFFDLNQKKFIFSISSHHYYKGFQILIQSYFNLLNNLPQLELIIGGNETNYTNYLKLICQRLGIEKRVKFIGPIDDATKIKLILESSVFVIPSLEEGFGVGALEARLLQVNVVATDVGAHASILKGYKFGRIVKPGDAKNLKDSIVDLLTIDSEPPRLLDKEVAKKYSSETLAQFIISNI